MFRVAFPKVWTPEAMEEGQEKKYSIAMLFPKTADISILKKAAFKAAVDQFGPKDKWPRGFKWPIKDGDTMADTEGYAGHWVINARSTKKPGVIDRNKNVITEDEDAFYSGCYAYATLSVFAFSKPTSKGVAFSLLNVMKAKDGERFGGQRDAAADFADFEIEDDGSDDAEDYRGAEDMVDEDLDDIMS